MRQMDFYLVLLQSIFDFLISGLFNTMYNSVMIFNHILEFCDEWKKFKNLYDKDIPKQFDLYIEPELLLSQIFLLGCERMLESSIFRLKLY